jgi:D-alanyl-D-alanine carboxypeptidase
MRNTTFLLSRWGAFVGLLSLGFLFSCSKSNSGGGGNISSVTAFSFQQAGNAIPVASTAAISGNSINIFLPPGTNVNALVATYQLSDSATVTVNGTQQRSGVTPNDFSNPVTYTITSLNGASKIYNVYLTTNISSIDNNVSAFMTKYNVPGLTIAITLDERLVYLNSYGKGSIEDNQSVNSQSLFRISSLSKQITSAAIMRLLDKGQINLDQTVFGTNSILGNNYGSLPYGPGITNITVRELLHHTEGGWPDDNTDPLGQNPTMTPQQVISWGLNNVPLLDTIPGRSYYYSHFGYVILGRVIEKITGESYQDAVQSLILTPCGITDMKIGGNTLAERQANEVKYYSSNNISPYVVNVAEMDAANGWLASSTDMAKFLVNVDGLSGKTILTPNAINAMSAGSTARPGYACGWEVNSLNWWHDGRLPGTGTTQAITTQNGNFNYVILSNTSNSDPNFSPDMENIFWNASVNSWPSYDLFGGASAGN